MNNQGEKHSVIESTQSHLKALLKTGTKLPHAYFVLAETQTAGRGRSDHVWSSVPGNLHASILLTELPFSEITWIPLWVSVCIHKSLVEMGVDGLSVKLKWPNDLLLNEDKKFGGVLCEKIGDSVIVGIGLNLKASPIPEAGCLSNMLSTSPENVLEKIIHHLKRSSSTPEIREYFNRYGIFKVGDSVKWTEEKSGKKNEGAVIGLGEFGELKVSCQNNTVSLFSEEVQGVRSKK